MILKISYMKFNISYMIFFHIWKFQIYNIWIENFIYDIENFIYDIFPYMKISNI